jgi:RNA polymerase sigma-B factor
VTERDDAPGDGLPVGALSGRSRARRSLIDSNVELAQLLARRFTGRGEDYEDLVQVASLALVKAADRFDPSLGFEFSTFATRTIIGELKHHLRDKVWSVKAPRSVQELYLTVNGVIGDLTDKFRRSPTIHEIAVACGRRDDEVLVAMEAGRNYRTVSLDPTFEEPHFTIRVGERVEDASELSTLLAHLPDRERVILEMRFVEELKQEEIAERLGISQMHVSRLIRSALDRARSAAREGRSST